MDGVGVGKGGKTRGQGRGGRSGSGVNRSPISSPKQSPPCRKKGTSAPRLRANPASSPAPKPRSHIALRARSVAAALELPPPRPRPAGTVFLTTILAPLSVPASTWRGRTDRRARFVRAQAQAG